eukprot:8810104-Pyramimonas_sp.AAC.1
MDAQLTNTSYAKLMPVRVHKSWSSYGQLVFHKLMPVLASAVLGNTFQLRQTMAAEFQTFTMSNDAP